MIDVIEDGLIRLFHEVLCVWLSKINIYVASFKSIKFESKVDYVFLVSLFDLSVFIQTRTLISL
jgi:hypothetical protein